MYWQPNDSKGGNISSAAELRTTISEVTKICDSLPTPTPDIIIAGDLNLPKALWIFPYNGYFLTQQILDPTHRAGNILDIILTNNPDLINSYEVIPTSPISSHYLIKCTTFLSTRLPTFSISSIEESQFDRINLFSEKTNWEKIESNLSNVDWDSSFAGLSATQMLDKLITTCEEAVKDNAPAKKKKHNNSFPFVPRHRKILMRKRTKIRRRYHYENIPEKKASCKSS